MLSKFTKITMEQCFVLAVYLLSIALAFLSGYIVCRYENLEFGKSPIKVSEAQEIYESSN